MITEITIIHCDNCGETASRSDQGLDHWFRVTPYSNGPEYDYCSGRCLFAHAGVAPEDQR